MRIGALGLPGGMYERLDALFRADPYAKRLGVEIVQWSVGSATIAATVGDDQVNFVGVGHGGLIFSLADIAMSVASNSEGRISLAISFTIDFQRATSPGDRIEVTATTVNQTRRLSTHEAVAMVGDRRVGSGRGITYRIDDWHFGADAWPEEWRAAH